MGNVAVAWILGSELKPWPRNCDEITRSYQVQVRDGAGDILTIPTLASARMTDREVKDGILDFTCEWDYKVGALSPAPAYTFVLLSDGGSEVEDSKTVPGNSVTNGKAPELFTTFCPGCSPAYQ
jgi:hypothetical protein